MLATLTEQVQHRAAELRAGRPELRAGQAMFTALWQISPDCGQAILDSYPDADPFYEDGNIGRFRQFIADWEKTRG